MAVGSSNFAELLWPGIKKVYGYQYQRYPTLYTKYVEKVDSELAFEKFQGVTQLPRLRVKDQGNTISYADPLLGFQTLIDPIVYSLGVSITREMYDDDQYSYINKVPKMLAESARQTQEILCANVLNNGFSSSFLGSDGKALFSTTHPLVDALAQSGQSGIGVGVFRNQPSTAADLTQTSLEAAYIDMGNMVDDIGLNMPITPNLLVVAVDNRFQAQKVLETEFEVDTGNNTVNPVKGIVKPLIVPYLTDADAWFLKTDVDDGIYYTERNAPNVERDNEFDTFNLKMVVWFRAGVGFVNPRAWYGSPGA